MSLQYIETSVHGLTLRGTAHIPETLKGGKYPTVIMFHGFGANRIEYFYSFVQISRLLEKHGIAAVRFDFGGHGESEGDFYDVTISGEVEEGKAIVNYVRQLEFVDSSRVSLMGMSLGSVVASIVAGDLSKDIHSLCMWSPAATVTDEINNKKTIQGQSISSMDQQGYFDFNSLRLGPGFIEDVASLDIYTRASSFKGNVAIIHGDQDFIAPIQYAYQYEQAYSQPISIQIIEGADHSWGNVPHREELFRNTLDFFEKNAK
ncbi:alpha/beta fold family hydrolase [Paenibacillus terrae HPL-003]|uniref:Alpha/beta fold family hydrolase n=1 Tax=Paenibacillus terrae (strain HPL-003) TaxID=985665 RepID=G7W1M6_PAETH|nr:alpha/beta hydrolase [Paenibacillus terrae]AET58030.1 alpha/beta fold family hydrolase [Paenibacillus terrae HPL-003]